MAVSRTSNIVSRVVGTLLLVVTVARGADPVPTLATSKIINAALLYPQPLGTKKYNTTSVPVFPGTKFYSTVCGGPNVDRTTTINTDKIVYTQDRGPSGNALTLEYTFATATLKITVFETYKPTVLSSQTLELSSLLDDASDAAIQDVQAETRLVAVKALEAIIKHMGRFRKRNQEAACMAFLFNTPPQPYSPDIVKTIQYLTRIRNDLLYFAGTKRK